MRSYVPATQERDGVAPWSRSCAPGLNMQKLGNWGVHICGCTIQGLNFVEEKKLMKKDSCHLVPKVVIDLPFEGRKKDENCCGSFEWRLFTLQFYRTAGRLTANRQKSF